MPQLPSGRHVGLAAEPIQEWAKTGNIQFKVGFYKYVKKPAASPATGNAKDSQKIQQIRGRLSGFTLNCLHNCLYILDFENKTSILNKED